MTQQQRERKPKTLEELLKDVKPRFWFQNEYDW